MTKKINLFLIHMMNLSALFTEAYYLYRYNYILKDNSVNSFTVPLMGMHLIFYYFAYKKNEKMRNFFALFPAMTLVFMLIVAIGGVNAPGVFWISGIPIFLGTFYRGKGVYLGITIMLLFYSALYFFEIEINTLSTPLSHIDYLREKKVNLIHFSVTITSFLLYYLWLENKALKSLEAANKQLDTLLHVVLHDLSNPLTVLKLKLASLNRKYNIDERSIDQIENSFFKIEEIITNIRNFQLSSEIIESNREEVSPIFVENSVKEFFDQYNKKGIELLVLRTTDEKFLCDKKVLTDHILSNIISNAIKFSHEDSHIILKIFSSDNYIHINVIDNGVGMTEDLLDKVFYFDKKTSRTGTNGEVGTGYGLPIVKYFCDISFARLSLRSREGKGTTASLRFPIHKP